jgi:hypothetical protein
MWVFWRELAKIYVPLIYPKVIMYFGLLRFHIKVKKIPTGTTGGGERLRTR